METYRILNMELVKKYQESKIEIFELKKYNNILNNQLSVCHKENLTLKNIIKMYIESHNAIQKTMNNLGISGLLQDQSVIVPKNSPRKSRRTIASVKQNIHSKSTAVDISDRESFSSQINRVKGQKSIFSFSHQRPVESNVPNLNSNDNTVLNLSDINTSLNDSQELTIIAEEESENNVLSSPVDRISNWDHSPNESDLSIDETYDNLKSKVTVRRKSYSQQLKLENSNRSSYSSTLKEKNSSIKTTPSIKIQYNLDENNTNCSTPYKDMIMDINKFKTSNCFIPLSPISIDDEHKKISIWNDNSKTTETKSVLENQSHSYNSRPKRGAAPTNLTEPKLKTKMRRK